MAEAQTAMRAFDEPGTSATTKLRFVAEPHHAEFGTSVSERIVGDLRRARRYAAIIVDLPALGKPTSPTSARSFSSSRRS